MYKIVHSKYDLENGIYWEWDQLIFITFLYYISEFLYIAPSKYPRIVLFVLCNCISFSSHLCRSRNNNPNWSLNTDSSLGSNVSNI